MFRNWRSIFNGDGGPINARIPIYSFDGRDVLADPFWSVNLIDSLYSFVFFPLLFYLYFLSSICQAPEEHLARLHQQGSPSGGQTLWDVASEPRVRNGPVIEPDLRSAPGPADAELFQPVRRSLHRDPQKPLNPSVPLHRGSDPSHRKCSTLGGKDLSVLEKDVVFSTSLVLRVAFWGPHLAPCCSLSDITLCSSWADWQ